MKQITASFLVAAVVNLICLVGGTVLIGLSLGWQAAFGFALLAVYSKD